MIGVHLVSMLITLLPLLVVALRARCYSAPPRALAMVIPPHRSPSRPSSTRPGRARVPTTSRRRSKRDAILRSSSSFPPPPLLGHRRRRPTRRRVRRRRRRRRRLCRLFRRESFEQGEGARRQGIPGLRPLLRPRIHRRAAPHREHRRRRVVRDAGGGSPDARSRRKRELRHAGRDDANR